MIGIFCLLDVVLQAVFFLLSNYYLSGISLTGNLYFEVIKIIELLRARQKHVGDKALLRLEKSYGFSWEGNNMSTEGG